jgi:hypothetical protein
MKENNLRRLGWCAGLPFAILACGSAADSNTTENAVETFGDSTGRPAVGSELSRHIGQGPNPPGKTQPTGAVCTSLAAIGVRGSTTRKMARSSAKADATLQHRRTWRRQA